MLKYFRNKNPRGSSAWFIELRPKLSADKYNNSPEGYAGCVKYTSCPYDRM